VGLRRSCRSITAAAIVIRRTGRRRDRRSYPERTSLSQPARDETVRVGIAGTSRDLRVTDSSRSRFFFFLRQACSGSSRSNTVDWFSTLVRQQSLPSLAAPGSVQAQYSPLLPVSHYRAARDDAPDHVRYHPPAARAWSPRSPDAKAESGKGRAGQAGPATNGERKGNPEASVAPWPGRPPWLSRFCPPPWPVSIILEPQLIPCATRLLPAHRPIHAGPCPCSQAAAASEHLAWPPLSSAWVCWPRPPGPHDEHKFFAPFPFSHGHHWPEEEDCRWQLTTASCYSPLPAATFGWLAFGRLASPARFFASRPARSVAVGHSTGAEKVLKQARLFR